MRHRKSVVILAAVFLLAFIGKGFAGEGHGSHWGYEGKTGPEHWGELSNEFLKCSKGDTQSPIDIKDADKGEGKALNFDYPRSSKFNMLNNGHTIQVDYKNSGAITKDGKKFSLAQFHFHAPSEHTIAGKNAAMELHLVHKDDAGNLAVVGILIEKGAPNANFDAVFKNLPKKESEKIEVDKELNLSNVLPEKETYYAYPGSLTTPPCSENVKWFVLKTPIAMDEEQIKTFTSIFEKNNRPVQPLNGRKVTVSE